MKIFLICLLSLSFFGCSQQNKAITSEDITSVNKVEADIKNTDSQPSPTPENTYPGKAIDEVFPATKALSKLQEEVAPEEASVEIGKLAVNIQKFTPTSIIENSKSIFTYKVKSAGDYWGVVVGQSKLLGPDSQEIYVVTSGPGGVCCTNYFITDVSSSQPRNIFRSEDYGHFRHVMEIADVDSDGVYELFHFDSCFRYFMGDCGTCSPEPKVGFKYDLSRKQYLPNGTVKQDFDKADSHELELTITQLAAELKEKPDILKQADLADDVLVYTVDIFHTGDTKRAWKFFEQYYPEPTNKERAAIKERLANCPYVRYLSK